MKSKILMILAILMMVSTNAWTAEECFTWTKNPNLEGKDVNGVDGYRIYRDPTTDVQFLFPDIIQDTACNDPDKPGKCAACVPKIEDGKNHRYAATAFNDAGESDFSQTADSINPVEKRVIEEIDQAPGVPQQYIKLLIPVEVVK